VNGTCLPMCRRPAAGRLRQRLSSAGGSPLRRMPGAVPWRGRPGRRQASWCRYRWQSQGAGLISRHVFPWGSALSGESSGWMEKRVVTFSGVISWIPWGILPGIPCCRRHAGWMFPVPCACFTRLVFPGTADRHRCSFRKETISKRSGRLEAPAC